MAEYIEREALRKAFDRVRWFENADRDVIANELLSQMPTADVVEVRHGRWLGCETDESYGPYDTKAWYKCSVCGKNAYGRCWDDEWYSSPFLSDFCPFCGAKMDGKGEGE